MGQNSEGYEPQLTTNKALPQQSHARPGKPTVQQEKNLRDSKELRGTTRNYAYNQGMKRDDKALSRTSRDDGGLCGTLTAFKPTPEMDEVLKWFKDCDFQGSISSVFAANCKAEAVESRRVTFYHWHNTVPGFSAWWAEQSEQHFNRVLPRVHGAMFKAAVSDDGNAADRRLMLERFDPKYNAKDSADGRGPVTVQGDVVVMLQAMIQGVAGSVPAGSACFAAPAGALPGVVDVEAEEVDDDG